ncbi:MAG: flagellar FliJ family protein [Bdellovibrionales bacterium]
MKKFKFKYQSLLRVREMEEDLTKKDYGEALGNLQQAEGQREEILSAIQSARDHRHSLQNLPDVTANELQYTEGYVLGSKQLLLQKEQEIEHLQGIVDEKFELFTEAYKQTKIVKKLEENELKKFKKAYKKLEAKKQDEQNLMRIAGGIKFGE